MLEPFQLPFVQHGIVEVLILAVAGGADRHVDRPARAGVLRARRRHRRVPGARARRRARLRRRRSAPARPPRSSPSPSALLARREGARDRYDSLTALVLVAALAVGVILASDVFHSGRQRRDAAVRQPAARRRAATAPSPPSAPRSCSPAGCVLEQRWLATGFDPGSARALGARSAAPDIVAARARGARGGRRALDARRAAGHRAARRPGRDHAPGLHAPAPVAAATVALVAVEGVAGLWLSVQVNAPPGPAIAVLAGGVFAVVAAGRVARRAPRRPWPRPPPRRSRCSPAAATELGDGGARPGQGRRHHDADRRLRPRRRRRPGQGRPAPAAQHRPARLRAAPVRRARDGRRRRRPRSAATSSTTGWATSSRQPAATARSSTSARASRSSSPGESDGPEASRYDPHWWHDPRNAEAAVARDPRRADAGQPGRARRLRAQRRRLPAPGCARSTAGSRACMRARARGRSASSSPTTTPSATSPRRYGITVVGAVIPSQTTQAQPSAGDVARLTRLDPPRGRQGGLPRELGQRRSSRRRSRARPARRADYDALRRHARAEGLERRHLPAMERANADAMVRGFTGGSTGMPDRGDRDRSSQAEGAGRRLRRRARAHATSRSRCTPASASACSGPNGGGKTTLFRVLLGELAPLAGTLRRARALRASCRRPSARGSTSRSARSTSR